ncbi:unnamed protein product [Hydatigera taeniaeformis]|uniref:Transposase n=1 Tax=Hydatigena taeniaeformis TaxID=6205 RepID=A0A0R3WYZ0_HYDTA|nr:unnamed protein product [Hydatigera taeniaeformis]
MDSNPDDVKLLDFIQNKFTCCGVVGVEDYWESRVPSSCGATIAERTQRPVSKVTTQTPTFH